MTMRSITTAVAAMLVLGAGLPAYAQGQVQAVPRTGVSFANTITVRAWIESTDSETKTVVFTTPQGRLIECAVSDSVKNLDSIAEGTPADVTYNEVVTLLNLRQKGPGSREARKEGGKPDSTDIESTADLHGDRGRSRQQQGVGDRRPRRPDPHLCRDLDRQAGHAEEDQGRRRGDRADDAAAGHGDHAGEAVGYSSAAFSRSMSVMRMERRPISSTFSSSRRLISRVTASR